MDAVNFWNHVICEAIILESNKILLVYGTPKIGDDSGKFWGLPSSRFLGRVCHLHNENIDDYVREMISDQASLDVTNLELSFMQTFRKKHPPKLFFNCEVTGNPKARTPIEKVDFFRFQEIPEDIGPHKAPLQDILRRINPQISNETIRV